MNVLYVFGGEKAQGAEIVIERLICANAGHAKSHLILSPGTFADDLLQANKPYRITTLPSLKKLNRPSVGKFNYFIKVAGNFVRIPKAIHRYIRREKIDVVHANTIVPAVYLLPLVIYTRVFMPEVKWIWSDHDVRYFSASERTLAKMSVKVYHQTLVVSEAILRKYPGLEKKAVVLYNGLDIDVFKKDVLQRNVFREKHQIKPNDLVIGIAAAINSDKGQLELITVFKELNKRYHHLKLFLAGAIATQAQDIGAQILADICANRNVVHLGHVSPITAFYNGCDIIVNNSKKYRSEALGTSIYETMACETLVIAADTGGSPEIIDDGINGFLFETENMDALKKCLVQMIERINELEDLKKAARKKVLERFDLDGMVRKYNLILKALTH